MDSLNFKNPDPKTGQPGTLVTTTWFQNVNDEISNVITENGGTLDSTNTKQLYQTLQTTYAPINSPTFTGTPLVPDTNSSSNGKQIVNFESMQAYVSAGTLGYTPVHQGGGAGQGTNSVYIGWSGSYLKAQVDSTDLGNFAFQGWCNSTFLSLTGGNVTGTFTYNGATVATKNDVNNAETDVKNWVEAGGYNVNGQVNFGAWIEAGANKTMWGGSGTNGAIQSGDYVWSAGVSCIGYGNMQATLQVTDVNGNGGDPRVGAHLYVKDYNGVQTDWYFNTAGRLRDPKANYVDATPRGAIIMWYGSASNVPTGWAICDGTNGTPDLRDKVVVGAGIQALGHIAGDWNATATTTNNGNHNHYSNTQGHTLTVDEMPSHQHTYSWHGITSEGHGTDTMGSGGDTSTWNGSNGTSYTGGNQPHSHGINWDGDHNHSVTVSTQQPSFYLYYIMKTGN
ncbi:hypothetical protein ATPR_2695 [Acetobacter tropicalis NBRC 101654]|uniref:Tail fiber protein n=1 Tax=Acetobacter tropicalis NBRC 101654 TaxID=749388 RepID=F7VH46_9PROT|nr:hypothetical protein [Acetobacter tropicalis]GAA09691.1 hypothetical protein ATPR_2695 [Acetobacter tropicalis NBRC 101654]